MRLRVGEKEFAVKIADTEAKRRQGLSGIKSMPKNNGLWLKFQEPTEVEITMEKMQFPLDLVFIQDDKVQRVLRGRAGAPEPIFIGTPSDSVLELNEGEAKGIRRHAEVAQVGKKESGGYIDYVDNEKPKEPGELHILDEDGAIQANLQGSERVFSREHTNQLYKLAKQAEETGTDIDFKKVGRAMVRMINKQDTQSPEYVKE